MFIEWFYLDISINWIFNAMDNDTLLCSTLRMEIYTHKFCILFCDNDFKYTYTAFTYESLQLYYYFGVDYSKGMLNFFFQLKTKTFICKFFLAKCQEFFPMTTIKYCNFKLQKKKYSQKYLRNFERI